jgi:hypothetical protein
MQTDQAKKIVVLDCMKGYVEKYKKKDLRNLQGVKNSFSDHLKSLSKFASTYHLANKFLSSDLQTRRCRLLCIL